MSDSGSVISDERFDSMSAMSLTRRRFLEATGKLAAAASFGQSLEARMQSTARGAQSGAPGVELSVDVAALPDYSRDLERTWSASRTRHANDASSVIDAISTRQEVLDRQKDGRRRTLEDARRTARIARRSTRA